MTIYFYHVAGKMDDVLDRLRLVHMHRNVHRRFPIMVPVLLRSENSPRTLAPVASYQGLVDIVQEVCTSSALQAGAG